MNVLVIGSGGREHAIVWKLKESRRVKEVYCIPGNAGIARIAQVADISLKDFSALKKFVKEKKIDMTVVGPEAPLVNGIVDSFKKDNLPIIGPDAAAAQLEGSKVFAKSFMKKYGIPTAQYQVCQTVSEAKSLINRMGAPVVIKASGLAAGKGVILCETKEEAFDAVARIIEKKEFGSAGDEVIIEQLLTGEEASIIALCDGKTLFNLVPSQDHKRIYDNDQGPNTGGMGAYAPAPAITAELMRKIEQEIFSRFLTGIQKEKLFFRGIIYFGLMITAQGPMVLEFNVRFGDPETQVILPLLDGDLADIIEAVHQEKLEFWIQKNPQTISKKSAVCIVLASQGYPGSYEKGKKICGCETYNPLMFHAGTALKNNEYITSGGRVLGIVAVENDLASAIKKAYDKVLQIYFEGMQYRKDIGKKGLKR